jgi:hypothetical protein
MTTTIDVTIPLKSRRGLSDRELIELLITEAYTQAQGRIAQRGMGMLCTSLRLVDRSWHVRQDQIPEWLFTFEAEAIPLPDRLDKFARQAA